MPMGKGTYGSKKGRPPKKNGMNGKKKMTNGKKKMPAFLMKKQKGVNHGRSSCLNCNAGW